MGGVCTSLPPLKRWQGQGTAGGLGGGHSGAGPEALGRAPNREGTLQSQPVLSSIEWEKQPRCFLRTPRCHKPTFQISSLVAQSVNNLLAMWETWVRFLGWETPLEKGITTHSSILAWRIPWTEEPGRLQSMGVTKSQTWLSDFHFLFFPNILLFSSNFRSMSVDTGLRVFFFPPTPTLKTRNLLITPSAPTNASFSNWPGDVVAA